MRCSILTVATLLLAAPQLAAANWPERLLDQREAFREAWPQALDGDARPIRDNQLLLSDYPLYPDLQAAWMRSQIGRIGDQEIEQFVSGNPRSSAVRDLRYRWMKSLASCGSGSHRCGFARLHARRFCIRPILS